MKPPVLLKWPIFFTFLATVLMFSPACRAQAEVTPDHFDEPNTVPFENTSTFAATKTSKAAVSRQKAVVAPAQGRGSSANRSAQRAAGQNFSHTAREYAVAIQNERKPATSKSGGQ